MGYQINLETKLKINVENCNFKSITIAFIFALIELFQQYVSDILLHYFEEYYQSRQLATLLGVKTVKKKTTHITTKFKTLFGDIHVPQIQVRVVDLEGKKHQMSITRRLLGVSSRFQIPDFMKELIGWLGSVTTFRVGHNVIGVLTNFKCSLMSVWSFVQWYAKKISLNLSLEGTNEFEADGTGIPTKEGGKRGSELKKVFQKKKDGKLHLVGLSIGKYKDKSDWTSAFSELLKALESGLKKYKKIILSSDGDMSIIDTARSISEKIKIQKDKWHVFSSA